jgi:hypothetical protein
MTRELSSAAPDKSNEFASGEWLLRVDDQRNRRPHDRSGTEPSQHEPLDGICGFVKPIGVRRLDRGPYHRTLNSDHCGRPERKRL